MKTAYLYIRQSTLRQVFENTESTQRQYALRALDSLEKIAGDLHEEDVARAGSDAAPEQQAAAIEEAEKVASAAPGGKSIVDESVTQALGGGGNPTRRRRTRVGAAATCATNFLNGSIRCRQWMPSLSCRLIRFRTRGCWIAS